MIFVTGGTGFVGRQVVQRLVEADEKVRILVRKGTRFPLQHPQIIAVTGNILEPESILRGMEGCSIVIHLVGIIRETWKQTFEQVHADGTRNVVEAAKQNKVEKFVHMSALGTRENARSRYHQSKWKGEEAVRGSGIPYVIFRPSIIVGPEDQSVNLFAHMMKGFPGQFGIMPVIGNGKNRFQPIGVEEVADCFVKAALEPRIKNKEYALTGPDAMTYDEMLDCIMKILRVKKLKLHLPFPAARAAAFFMEKLPLAPLNRDQVVMLEEDNIGDNAEMRRDFGIEPRTFEKVIGGYLQ